MKRFYLIIFTILFLSNFKIFSCNDNIATKISVLNKAHNPYQTSCHLFFSTHDLISNANAVPNYIEDDLDTKNKDKAIGNPFRSFNVLDRIEQPERSSFNFGSTKIPKKIFLLHAVLRL